jgi:hypothetical protein
MKPPHHRIRAIGSEPKYAACVTAITADRESRRYLSCMKQGDHVTSSQWVFTIAGVVLIVLALVLSAHGA